ncbi:MAG: hypothetical protein U0736_07400 [Gemmataceae bacterium]
MLASAAPAVRTAKSGAAGDRNHGAGGARNMFFDGYGDGLIARLCARRGWLLVTTRSPLFAFSGVDAPAVVDALAKLYPGRPHAGVPRQPPR